MSFVRHGSFCTEFSGCLYVKPHADWEPALERFGRIVCVFAVDLERVQKEVVLKPFGSVRLQGYLVETAGIPNNKQVTSTVYKVRLGTAICVLLSPGRSQLVLLLQQSVHVHFV